MSALLVAQVLLILSFLATSASAADAESHDDALWSRYDHVASNCTKLTVDRAVEVHEATADAPLVFRGCRVAGDPVPLTFMIHPGGAVVFDNASVFVQAINLALPPNATAHNHVTVLVRGSTLHCMFRCVTFRTDRNVPVYNTRFTVCDSVIYARYAFSISSTHVENASLSVVRSEMGAAPPQHIPAHRDASYGFAIDEAGTVSNVVLACDSSTLNIVGKRFAVAVGIVRAGSGDLAVSSTNISLHKCHLRTHAMDMANTVSLVGGVGFWANFLSGAIALTDWYINVVDTTAQVGGSGSGTSLQTRYGLGCSQHNAGATRVNPRRAQIFINDSLPCQQFWVSCQGGKPSCHYVPRENFVTFAAPDGSTCVLPDVPGDPSFMLAGPAKAPTATRTLQHTTTSTLPLARTRTATPLPPAPTTTTTTTTVAPVTTTSAPPTPTPPTSTAAGPVATTSAPPPVSSPTARTRTVTHFGPAMRPSTRTATLPRGVDSAAAPSSVYAAAGIAPSTATVMATTSILATGGAGLLSPTAANKANTAGRLAATALCGVNEAELENDLKAPGWHQFVLPVALGSIGGVYATAVGAAVCTAAAVGVAFGASVGVARGAAVDARGPRRVAGVALALLLNFYGPNVVALGVAVAHRSDDGTGTVLALSAVALVAAVAAVVATAVVRAAPAVVARAHAYLTADAPSDAAPTASDTASLLTALVWCCVPLLESARSAGVPLLLRVHVLEDFAAAAAIGLLTGLMGVVSCVAVTLLIVCVALAHVAYVVALRPYERPLEQRFATALAAMQLLLAAVAAASVLAGSDVWLAAAAWVVVAFNVLFYVQAGVLAAAELRSSCGTDAARGSQQRDSKTDVADGGGGCLERPMLDGGVANPLVGAQNRATPP